ncbi:MAG: DUF5615 family PIN-like protein [Acidobacteria bacterium]|nr:DUF5615 family PIN-like protein [Acidobacteriota bacterium]
MVKVLRELGHSVITVLESGMANQALPDIEVLRYATSQDRVLLTYNRKHFLQLHRDSPTHAGIIVCTYDPDAVGQADKIHLAVKDVELSGRVLRIYREGFRLD